MASFSLVHGAWHGGWCWDLVRAELEVRGHIVHTPDLACEDVAAGVEEYAATVPAADLVVGHSLGATRSLSSAVIRPDSQRRLARDVLGVEPLELDAGHSPMLECPRELADLLDALV